MSVAARPTFTGVIPALPTPFTPSLELAADRLRSTTSRLVDAGFDTVVVLGTIGEASSLTHDERAEVISIAREGLGNEGKLLVGVSSSKQSDSISLARQAQELSADGVMCQPPVSYSLDDREILRFFSDVAESTGLPMMIYNNPTATHTDLSPALLARIVRASSQ